MISISQQSMKVDMESIRPLNCTKFAKHRISNLNLKNILHILFYLFQPQTVSYTCP